LTADEGSNCRSDYWERPLLRVLLQFTAGEVDN
jgi:hypothetical protein